MKILFFAIFLLVIQVNGKFWCSYNSKLHCEFEKNIKCEDPSLDILEILFARKEFHFLDILEQIKGSYDSKHIIDQYPIFDVYNNELIKLYNQTKMMAVGPRDCNYNSYETIMERSLCPWKENHMKRDNVYPFQRKFAECLQCQDAPCSKHIEKKDNESKRYKCTEVKNLELILYRSQCMKNIYTWEVGFEQVSSSCKCILPDS